MPCSHWDSHAIYEKKAYYHRKPAGKKELISTGGRERRREGGEGGKEGRREGGKEGRREGRKEGRKGGREGGRKEGGRQEERNKGLASKCCVHLPIYTCYFQRVASPTRFTSSGFKIWQARRILQISAATRCKHHAACNAHMTVSTCCKYQSTCSFELQKAAK